MYIFKAVYTFEGDNKGKFIKEVRKFHLRDKLLAQPGCICFDMVEPLEIPDTIFLIDMWEDKKSLEAHIGCAPIKEWTVIKKSLVKTSGWTMWEAHINEEYVKEVIAIQTRIESE